MTWSEIDFHPGEKKLRQFASLFFAFALIAGCWQVQLSHHRLAGYFLAGAGMLVLLVGLIRPYAMCWLYQAMMAAAFPFGWATSRLLLSLAYFTLFTPLAWFFRLRRRDRLGLRLDTESASYWKARPAPSTASQYFRPY
jgi:hypothetical protein